MADSALMKPEEIAWRERLIEAMRARKRSFRSVSMAIGNSEDMLPSMRNSSEMRISDPR